MYLLIGSVSNFFPFLYFFTHFIELLIPGTFSLVHFSLHCMKLSLNGVQNKKINSNKGHSQEKRGTYAQLTFVQGLVGTVKPQTVTTQYYDHPVIMSTYFQIGFQNSSIIHLNNETASLSQPIFCILKVVSLLTFYCTLVSAKQLLSLPNIYYSQVTVNSALIE